MKRNITCIICPRGCEMEAELTGGGVSVSGFGCARGRQYAENELIRPVRTLTTTVVLRDGSVIPVRTDRPVPKERMFDCMEAVRGVKELPDCSPGSVVIADVCGTGADLIVD